MLIRVLVEDGVQIADQVVLQHNLVREEVGQDREGRFVEAWQGVAQRFVGAPVGDLRALEVGFVLSQGDILAIRARLLLLQGVAAALVALIVDLRCLSA